MQSEPELEQAERGVSVSVTSAFDLDASDAVMADSIKRWIEANEDYSHPCWPHNDAPARARPLQYRYYI